MRRPPQPQDRRDLQGTRPHAARQHGRLRQNEHTHSRGFERQVGDQGKNMTISLTNIKFFILNKKQAILLELLS